MEGSREGVSDQAERATTGSVWSWGIKQQLRESRVCQQPRQAATHTHMWPSRYISHSGIWFMDAPQPHAPFAVKPQAYNSPADPAASAEEWCCRGPLTHIHTTVVCPAELWPDWDKARCEEEHLSRQDIYTGPLLTSFWISQADVSGRKKLPLTR